MPANLWLSGALTSQIQLVGGKAAALLNLGTQVQNMNELA